MAFACMFLATNKLSEYLSQLAESLVCKGDLSGLLLTGAGPEAGPLLQQYIDLTGDLQTVSLVILCTFPPLVLEKDQALDWVTR